MPYIEFEFVEMNDGYVALTDEMGTIHYIPEHMVPENVSDLPVGSSINFFVSDQYCKKNGIFV